MQRYPLILLLPIVVLCIWLLRERISPDTFVDEGSHIYLVHVTDYPIERQKTWRYEVEVLTCIDTSTVYQGARAIAYVAKDSTIGAAPWSMGERVWVRSRWQDGGHYAMHGYVPQNGWSVRDCVQPAWYHPRVIRRRLLDRYQALGITGREYQTVGALTLGYREELDRDLKSHFQRAGAAHVLAVSGLHTGILYLIVLALLTGFGCWKPLYEERGKQILLSLTVIALMSGYAVLTGLSPSVVRSVVMLSLYEIAVLLRRERMSLNTLAAAAIFILVARPTDLWSVGFWLSFTAVAALMTMRVPTRTYMGGVIVASLAAQLGTLPITMHCFGQVSNYFLLTNIIVIPLATVLLSLSLATLTLGWVPYLGSVLAWLTRTAAWLMNESVGWIEQLPGAVTPIRCSIAMMLLLYAAIVMGILTIKKSLWWAIGVTTTMIIWCILYIYE